MTGQQGGQGRAGQGLDVLEVACVNRLAVCTPELHHDVEEGLQAAHPGGAPGNCVLSG